MSGLQGLGSLLGDPELRSLVANLVSRKISADLKTLEAHAELSRRLTDNRKSGGEGNATLKRIIREHLDYYGTLVALSHTFHQRLLDLLADLREDRGEGASVNGVALALKGSPGGTARGRFTIANGRADSVSVTCHASPFVSEDGSQLVASDIAFDPPAAEIAPGAEAVFHAAVPIGPDLLVGRTYLASLGAEGVGGVNIVVRLAVEEQEPPRAAAAAAEPGAKPKRAKRKKKP